MMKINTKIKFKKTIEMANQPTSGWFVFVVFKVDVFEEGSKQ